MSVEAPDGDISPLVDLAADLSPAELDMVDDHIIQAAADILTESAEEAMSAHDGEPIV
jgi:hypothetical protein